MKSTAIRKPSSDARATQRMETSPSPRRMSSPVTSSPGKSACACGGGCPRCYKKSSVQAKLRVSQPGDALEREADQIADQMLRAPASTAADDPSASRAPVVARRAGNSSVASLASANVSPTIHRALNAPGRALDTATRGFFEPRLGRDLSSVRVHTDANAAQSINAEAFTFGQHIVFDRTAYRPHDPNGKRLLAHELVHVVQQSSGAPASLQRQCRTGSACDAPICGDPGAYAERVTALEPGGADAPPPPVRAMPGGPPATGHGSRATNLVLLAAEWGIDLSEVGGVYVSEDIESGGESAPCVEFEGWGAAYRTLTFDRSTWCIFVRPEDEARAAELVANPASGDTAVFLREISYLRGLLLHERAHTEFDSTAHAGLGASTCTRDTVIFTGSGPTPYGYDVQYYLSELAAIVSEFPPLLQATRTRVGNYESILYNLRRYFQHQVFNCDESIRGILTALRCHCPCEEIDNYVRDTFLFASRDWSDSERGIFQDLMRSRFPSAGWPAMTRAQLGAGPAEVESEATTE
jgi:hypothetical protein